MDLRYPIGQYEPQPFSDKQKREWAIIFDQVLYGDNNLAHKGVN